MLGNIRTSSLYSGGSSSGLGGSSALSRLDSGRLSSGQSSYGGQSGSGYGSGSSAYGGRSLTQPIQPVSSGTNIASGYGGASGYSAGGAAGGYSGGGTGYGSGASGYGESAYGESSRYRAYGSSGGQQLSRSNSTASTLEPSRSSSTLGGMRQQSSLDYGSSQGYGTPGYLGGGLPATIREEPAGYGGPNSYGATSQGNYSNQGSGLAPYGSSANQSALPSYAEQMGLTSSASGTGINGGRAAAGESGLKPLPVRSDEFAIIKKLMFDGSTGNTLEKLSSMSSAPPVDSGTLTKINEDLVNLKKAEDTAARNFPFLTRLLADVPLEERRKKQPQKFIPSGLPFEQRSMEHELPRKPRVFRYFCDFVVLIDDYSYDDEVIEATFREPPQRSELPEINFHAYFVAHQKEIPKIDSTGEPGPAFAAETADYTVPQTSKLSLSQTVTIEFSQNDVTIDAKFSKQDQSIMAPKATVRNTPYDAKTLSVGEVSRIEYQTVVSKYNMYGQSAVSRLTGAPSPSDATVSTELPVQQIVVVTKRLKEIRAQLEDISHDFTVLQQLAFRQQQATASVISYPYMVISMKCYATNLPLEETAHSAHLVNRYSFAYIAERSEASGDIEPCPNSSATAIGCCNPSRCCLKYTYPLPIIAPPVVETHPLILSRLQRIMDRICGTGNSPADVAFNHTLRQHIKLVTPRYELYSPAFRLELQSDHKVAHIPRFGRRRNTTAGAEGNDDVQALRLLLMGRADSRDEPDTPAEPFIIQGRRPDIKVDEAPKEKPAEFIVQRSLLRRLSVSRGSRYTGDESIQHGLPRKHSFKAGRATSPTPGARHGQTRAAAARASSEEEIEAEEAEHHEPAEEEEAEEEAPAAKPKPPPQQAAPEEGGGMSEAQAAIEAAKAREAQENEEKLKEYEESRRIQREKEDEELRNLKEKQEERRRIREEEDRQMGERRKAEEERRKQEEEDRKAKIEADKKKKEAEKQKRQQMMAGLGAAGGDGGANFVIPEKSGDQKMDKLGNIMQAKSEMGMTKEQMEEKKNEYIAKISEPMDVSDLDVPGLRNKLKELHARICKLEADRYDLEIRHQRQEYDLKELNERQRQINRNKALKKGLDPDAANSKYPPKIATASKYDRQIDRRSYGDRRELYESSKKRAQKAVFHGSCRPPVDWGRTENEELENIRKMLEPPKYVELAPVEGAKPPMAPVASKGVPEDGATEAPAPAAAAPAAAAPEPEPVAAAEEEEE